MTSCENFVFENTDIMTAKEQTQDEQVCIDSDKCYVINDVPDNSKKYSCKRCGKTFKLERNVKQHFAAVHKAQKELQKMMLRMTIY